MSTREREKAKRRRENAQKAPPRAILKRLRMSPFKVRRVVDLVRGKAVDDAVVILSMSEKRAAKPVLKLLKSAMANAEEKGIGDVESLQISTAMVDEGQTLRRWRPRAMGRATRIRKRTSDITLILDHPKNGQTEE